MKKGSKQEQDQQSRQTEEKLPDKVRHSIDKADEALGIKFWVTKTIIMFGLLIGVLVFLDTYLQFDILIIGLTGIIIALVFGFFHEVMHYWKAHQLGYEVEWWRTTFRMGFNVDSGDRPMKQWNKDNTQIALAPYYLVIPIATIFLVVGIIFQEWGVVLGCSATLLMHAFSFTKEGKEVVD
jgi:fatty acid desaturase